MGSIWKATARMSGFPALDRDISTDVLIIGGGMAGVLTAHMLKERGADCVLCEARTLADGTTANTTAKLTSQHGLIYDKLIREFGQRKAALYLRANEEALGRFIELCRGIDCDLERKDNYIYTLSDPAGIDRELAALKRLGFPAERAQELPLPFKTAGAVVFRDQAQFHPLRFIEAAARGLRVFEHTRVLGLKPEKGAITARVRGASVRAKRVVVATHFPIFNKHGAYFLKLYQHRSYVLALRGAPDLGGMFLGEGGGLSFRNYNGLLLMGGGGRRPGGSGGGFRELEAEAKRYFPAATVDFAWAAQDCMSLDSVPYIGNYSAGTPDMYVATGFNKWGMTGSMTAAALLCDLLCGRPNPYAEVFSPSRTVLRPGLASNVLHSLVGLLTPRLPRCPHLGCALKWNPRERTWECPCHGSRFKEDGSLLDGPATGGLKIK